MWQRWRGRAGFTSVQIGLMLCGAVCTAIAAAVVLAFIDARQKAQRTGCWSNIKEVGQALSLYVQDYDNVYPAAASRGMAARVVSWQEAIAPYSNSYLTACPACEQAQGTPHNNVCIGFALNSTLAERTNKEVRDPAKTVVLFDARAGMLAADHPDTASAYGSGDQVSLPGWEGVLLAEKPGALRHQGSGTYLFLDGHALCLEPAKLRGRCGADSFCFRSK